MRFIHVVPTASGIAVCCAALMVASVWAGCGSDSDGDTSSSSTGEQNCETPAACTDVQSECVALVDNSTNDKPVLRISNLKLNKPDALASAFVQDLVTDGVLLNKAECRLDGKGTFTWLLEFDKANGTLRTGGAPPSTPEEGYCFLSGELGGQDVSPIVTDVTVEGGAFEFSEGSDVAVPVYLDETGENYVLLPLKSARIYDATISDDYNCIGQYNDGPDGLSPQDQCFPSNSKPAFLSGAKLDGYITLEGADSVVIKELSSTLCTILAGEDDGADPVKKCVRDGTGAIAFKGDWCSTTNSAGGCEDSVVLGADFAASAVKLAEGCN